MYMLYIAVVLAFALGFGIWSQQDPFGPSEMAEANARAAASIVYARHSHAVQAIEAGQPLPGDETTIGAITYKSDALDYFHTEVRPGGTNPADGKRYEAATITWIIPDDQNKMRAVGRLQPDAVLRQLIELAGDNSYLIGVYHEEDGTIRPLDRSSLLMAPSDTPWSPMDDTSGVQWLEGPAPKLPVPPPGLEDGSWLLMTVTPAA